MVGILGCHCHGPGSVPGRGTEIPQAMQRSQKKKERKKGREGGRKEGRKEDICVKYVPDY